MPPGAEPRCHRGDCLVGHDLDLGPVAWGRRCGRLLAQAKQAFSQAYNPMIKAGEKDRIPRTTDGGLVFDQAATLLWEPDLSAALRAAVYKVLAATPGVTVKTGATDSSGRPAVEISRFDTSARQDIETYEDPTTGATLESAWVGPAAEFAGDLYLSTTCTNTIPADPYKGRALRTTGKPPATVQVAGHGGLARLGRRRQLVEDQVSLGAEREPPAPVQRAHRRRYLRVDPLLPDLLCSLSALLAGQSCRERGTGLAAPGRTGVT